MQTSLFRRGVSFVLTLALILSAGSTVFAAEADGLCEHHPSHTEDCGYAASGECTHECTEDSGCISTVCSHQHVATCYNGAGKLNCHHKCDKTPECQVPVTVCVHIRHGSCGHSDGKDCSYATGGCMLCNAVELKGTDVVLPDGTVYTHTGSLIMPTVTVTVDGTVLAENKDYIVTYANNINVGTGTVIVTGTETSGYKGTVEIPFTIAAAQEPSEPTEPSVPGEPTIPSEPTTPSEPTKPSEPTVPSEPTTPSEPTVPSEPTTPSEPTVPSEPTAPSEPEAEPRPAYKITKGSGSKWRQESGKDLSFDLNADTDDITGISIDGKKLGNTHYTIADKDTVTLKNSWLKNLAIGTYRITVHFADGTASGTFTVAAATDSSNPKTADTIGLWIGIALTSLAGIGGTVLLLRKRSA